MSVPSVILRAKPEGSKKRFLASLGMTGRERLFYKFILSEFLCQKQQVISNLFSTMY